MLNDIFNKHIIQSKLLCVTYETKISCYDLLKLKLLYIKWSIMNVINNMDNIIII